MDKTETYIKMCDCPEIQKGHEPADWDYYYLLEIAKHPWDGIFVLSGYGTDGGYYGPDPVVINCHEYSFRKKVWLPTQDKLQEMVTDTIDCPSHSSCAIFINVGHRIHQWCDEAWDYWMQFTSMEQLWLAFVMKEKYNKTWDGEKWMETCRD